MFKQSFGANKEAVPGRAHTWWFLEPHIKSTYLTRGATSCRVVCTEAQEVVVVRYVAGFFGLR